MQILTIRLDLLVVLVHQPLLLVEVSLVVVQLLPLHKLIQPAQGEDCLVTQDPCSDSSSHRIIQDSVSTCVQCFLSLSLCNQKKSICVFSVHS